MAFGGCSLIQPPPGVTQPPAPEPARGSVRVAGIVLKWIRADKSANYARIEPLVREAAGNGADLVVTTECFLDGYAVADKTMALDAYQALGEPVPDGPFYRRLAALADELDIVLVAGVTEAASGSSYNTALVIGPDGELVGRYHKQRLDHELGRNIPGDESPVFETPFGNLGVMICADRRERSIVAGICAGGAEFLVCPSGGMFGPHKNDGIVRARSRENGVHIVFVHPAEFLVTDPRGKILQRSLVGDRLGIAPQEQGTAVDAGQVFYFDLPRGAGPGRRGGPVDGQPY